jgi:MerR family transcriptional regulator, redox-sensitive transcriptional activator SoxR
MGDGGMRIGEVAERAGVRQSLLRWYEEVGLLPAPPRVGGQRRYDPAVLRRLEVIDVAQRAGLSLREIGALLEHGDDPPAAAVRELAARRLADVEELIARAGQVRTWLQAAAGCGCAALDDCALFDPAEVALPSAKDARPLAIVRVGARA